VRDALLAQGHEPAALEQAAINVGFDLWRAVATSYASAYLRWPAPGMACGTSCGGDPRARWQPAAGRSEYQPAAAERSPGSRRARTSLVRLVRVGDGNYLQNYPFV
jgi:hydroxybutyrate-dimer hydrolase